MALNTQQQQTLKVNSSGRKWRDVFVALYAATQNDLKSDRERIAAEKTMQRALEDVERLLTPRPAVRYHNPRAKEQGTPCLCALCFVLREYERHQRALAGKQTSSWGEATTLNAGTGQETQGLAASRHGGQQSSPIEAALDSLTRIEALLETAAHRNDLRKILERHGLGHNLAFEPCSVCDDERLREIDTLLMVDGKSLRDVEAWTATTGRRLGRETLRKHAAHQRGA